MRIIDILMWFIQESGHPGFTDVPIPEDFPQPFTVEDAETKNNMDKEVIASVETSFGGGSYLFLSAQNPN